MACSSANSPSRLALFCFAFSHERLSEHVLLPFPASGASLDRLFIRTTDPPSPSSFLQDTQAETEDISPARWGGGVMTVSSSECFSLWESDSSSIKAASKAGQRQVVFSSAVLKMAFHSPVSQPCSPSSTMTQCTSNC
eukprot:2880342-Rhodomonas_salina.2